MDAFQDPEDYKDACIAYVNDLVTAYNWHKHKRTCFKYAASEGSIPTDPELQDKLCRMRIDGTTREETTVDEDTGSILLRRLHPRIANFNDIVMLLLRGNMDIKFIGSGEAAQALVYYITDYITKSSVPVHVGLGALSYAIKKTNEILDELASDASKLSRTALTATVNRMMSRQEISHQQVMSYLVGSGDYYTSHSFKMLHWRAFDKLFKRHFREETNAANDSLGGERQETVTGSPDVTTHEGETSPVNRAEGNSSFGDLDMAPDPDDMILAASASGNALDEDEDMFTLTLSPGSVGATNQQQDYIYRPLDPVFDGLCLYEFVGGVEKVSKPSRGQRGEETSGMGPSNTRRGRRAQARGEFASERHTQFNTHLLRRRTVFSVPLILGDRVPRHDRGDHEREQWARMMLILFVPWRQPSDLRGDDETWLHAYERQSNSISERHQEIIAHMNVLSECRDVRDSHRAMRRVQAVALLNEWLPQPDNNLNREYDEQVEDEADDEQFEIIRTGTTFDHSGTGDLQQSAAILDSKIGSTERVAFAYCFKSTVGTDRFSQANDESQQSRQIVENDLTALEMQASVMRWLKRVRRPQHTPDPNPRPRQRQRIEEVVEHVGMREVVEEPERRVRGPIYNPIDIGQAIDQVVEEMNLDTNVEQERAFRIVGGHLRQGGDQLLMYIAGVGGTGKTHVVKAIRRLFELLNRSKEILVGAPTGAAAKNIDGYTVHSLVMLKSKGRKNIAKLQELWAPVRYFIIDEVSMIGAKFLSEISSRLQEAKGVQGEAALEPFGGVHVIFTGDFGQLRPVSAMSLYDHKLVKNPGLQVGQTIQGVNSLKGVYLWRLVRTVVVLTKNQRQKEDPVYADLLSRVRVGQCRARPDNHAQQSDVDVLFKRVAHGVLRRGATELQQFADAPVIVGSKALRDVINRRRAFHHAAVLGETCQLYHSKDRIRGSPVHARLREPLWDVASNKSEDSLGRLPLFRGMKVMLQENIAFSKGLVNGAEGTVEEILWEEEHGYRYATVAYVRVPNSGIICPEKGEDIVPIFPESTRFNVQVIVNGKVTARRVTRSQLPILPAYAYTDYKSQGKSLTRAIVDIESAHSLQGVYVMLSRVKTLEGLLLLRPFVPSKLCRRLSQELREELERIDALSETTRIRYEQDRLVHAESRMEQD